MTKRSEKATPHPKNIDGKPAKERVPAPDQEPAGHDAEGKPVYRRKQSAIDGPRAGKSSVGGRRRASGDRF